MWLPTLLVINDSGLSPAVDRGKPDWSRRRNCAGDSVREGLSAKLHARFGVFLEKVADVDGQTLEFFVEGLPRAEAESLARARDVAIVAYKCFGDQTALVVVE